MAIPLAGAAVVALLWFGGVSPGARVVVHLALAVALGMLVFLPSRRLRHLGAAQRMAVAGGAMALAGCAGLLPLPGLLAPIAAPAWSGERPAGWGFASLDVGATIDVLTGWAMVTAAAVGVAAWSARRGARDRFVYLMVGGAACLVALAAAHVGQGARVYFGSPVPYQMPFFAPFINPNHYGSMLLLGFPFAAGIALSRGENRAGIPRPAAAGVALGIVGMVLWTRSSGPLLVLALQVVLLLRTERGVPWWMLALGLAPLAPLALVYDLWFSSGERLSLHGRLPIWWATLRMAAGHWLFGAGAGTYEAALAPYRTDRVFESWHHAHNDWLEWVAETGVVGSVALGFALWTVRPQPAQAGSRHRFALVALAGVAAHALLDFPFRLPAIAIGAAAVLGWRAAAFDKLGPARPLALRLVLGGLLLAQLGAAAWQARNVLVRDAIQTLQDGPRGGVAHRDALHRLQRLAPRRAEVQLERAIAQHRAGSREQAVASAHRVGELHLHDARAQAAVGAFFLAIGDAQAALPYAERAVARGPSDWRNWELRARVLRAAQPEQAAAACVDVLLMGRMNLLPDCWEALPVGVYWVNALEDASLSAQVRLARFLVRREPEAALLAFDSVVRRDPTQYHPEHAALLIDLDPAAAGPFLERALRVHPDDEPLTRELARLYQRQGQWQQAADAWDRLASSSADARVAQLECVRRAKGPGEALMQLDRARTMGESLGDGGVFLRADLYRELGQARSCSTTLVTSGLLDRQRSRKRARQLLDRCDDPTPPTALR